MGEGLAHRVCRMEESLQSDNLDTNIDQTKSKHLVDCDYLNKDIKINK